MKCKVCRTPFERTSIGHKACSIDCALVLARTSREKSERCERKKRLTELKTRSQWMKEAQAAFNKYVRIRDHGKPCICCGKPLVGGAVGGAYDCGHYRSVGSAPHLRFNPNNAHGQLKQCNRWGSGRAVDYRIGLIQRIGLEAVEELESDNSVRKYTIPELKEIKQKFSQMAKELDGAKYEQTIFTG